MILVLVMELCRDFDRAVVALEMALRVVVRSADRPATKLTRARHLMELARVELCVVVREAKLELEKRRGGVPADEVRVAGERLALVQLVLANRMAAMTMVERLQIRLARGEVTANEAEQWVWHFLGLVSCDMPAEAWTDGLGIPAVKPVAEA